jgi:T3SS negative regulator,GrlR
MVADLTSDFDGAWYAVFGAQLRDEGIVLLRNGFILGCDDQYFYEGRYVRDDDGGFRSLVKVSHYAGDGAVSVFGDFGPFATLESFHAELRGGQDSNGTLQLSGGVTGDPDRRLDVALKLSRLVPNPVRQA